ncbi:MAG TPA: NADPH:quinone oxidoreductase family protein [Steroidobacteraceae bacterium]|nr:NADPH:quinone oxidoreductase family protein [Steroidobacteraceae bacterium]
MKAAVCKAFGPPETLVLDTTADPEPGPRQVLVDVAACGVNFPDALMVAGKYQSDLLPPFIPGGECAGTVLAVGAEVRDIAVGARVIALCGHGGFAERVVADAGRIVPIPDGMDFVPASAFLVTYGTAWHALKQRARLRDGETLLVLGAAGGVGLAAVELGKALGARVIAAASSAEKLALAMAHGADATINYATEDLKERARTLTAGKGVDVVFDPVGAELFEPAVRATGWNGRVLVIGFAGGSIPKLPVNLPLLKGSAVVGVFWGEFTRREPRASAQNNRELLAMFLAGQLRPHVSATFPLQRAAEALRVLTSRKALGKVVVAMGA